ncbi:MAG: neutral/alkaline non-lysosomal ceramidase N-terminal domain-containing protein, partial [Erysipelotrichaceae bacterium]|nr:neutral/alkaline non-lysosomal ceramidase N-terminal domain-containing protein [Erysipelotrichaceae bacterium]
MKAGISRIEITPALHMTMSGFRERDHGAESFHDPLYATCVVLEDEAENKCAWLTCDMIHFDRQLRERVLDKLADKTTLGANNILMQATHTHSGPLACTIEATDYLDREYTFTAQDEAYYHFLVDALTQVILQAESRLVPSKVGFASGSLTSLGNNRNEPEKYMDNSVNVLKIEDLEGECRGLMVNYACHPTVLTFSSYRISADFPGAMRKQLSAVFPNAIIAFSQGACGNISTRFTRRENTVRELDRLAYGLSGEVLKLLAEMRTQDAIHIRTMVKTVQLPIRDFPTDEEIYQEIADIKAEMARLKETNGDPALIRKAYVSLQGPERNLMIKKNIGDIKEVSAELQVIDTGLFRLVTLPGEAFSEIARDIKHQSTTVVCGYANDYLGYILSREGYENAGYEK